MGERGVSSIIVAIMIVVVIAAVASFSYYLFARVALTRITDIASNPSKYMGKQVELKGTVTMFSESGNMPIRDGTLNDGGGNIFLIYLPDNFFPIGAAYLVKGTVTNYTLSGRQTVLAIDVSSIRLAD
jgi:hypothetical protein